MDRIKAVLKEIDLKAENASDAYELIMSLIKEASPETRTSGSNDRLITSGDACARGERAYAHVQQ